MSKPKNVLELYNKYKDGIARFKKREEKLLVNKEKNAKKIEKLNNEKLEFQKQFANLFINKGEKNEQS